MFFFSFCLFPFPKWSLNFGDFFPKKNCGLALLIIIKETFLSQKLLLLKRAFLFFSVESWNSLISSTSSMSIYFVPNYLSSWRSSSSSRSWQLLINVSFKQHQDLYLVIFFQQCSFSSSSQLLRLCQPTNFNVKLNSVFSPKFCGTRASTGCPGAESHCRP